MKRFIGLDVHKEVVEVCAIDEAGKRLFRRRIACTRESLLGLAQDMTQEDSVALEATTNTWAVVDLLEPHVGRVVVGNPMKTKAIAEAKIKTDKVDAEVLAQLLRCDYLPSVWIPDAPTRALRQRTSRRARLVAERTRLKNRIQSVLAGLLMRVPVDTLFSAKGLAWLSECDLPAPQRAVVESDLRLLAAVNQEIGALEKSLKQLAWNDPRVRLLMTMPGVDYAVALTLIAALGDLSRFPDGDHAASYLGLVPSTKQSANHCYHGPITKRGRSHARWMLTQSAQNIARHAGPLGVFFRRLARRKCWNVAVVATARKLVTIAWMMLKTGEPYRYAQPATVQRNLASLRVAVTGRKRKASRKGRPRSETWGSGIYTRTIPSLGRVCHQEQLPPVHGFEQLPAGEQRVLKSLGVIEYVQQIGEDRQVPRTRNSSRKK